ncbi:Uncharacterized protein P5673_023606 [Acropora cervicornis]|uniref:Integrase catalytic domain-containing protein n=1 Tax=Acropora cervicornis TaxID=6130 RepID=A0AAD9Q597_ACRCE|nr:Uncharacterized protein P5673_023606 [Acropora cervicornis]
MQEDKPVAFSSKTLTLSEKMYANVERELLAIELGLERSTLKRFKDSSSADETSRVIMEYVLKGWLSEKEQVDELTEGILEFQGRYFRIELLRQNTAICVINNLKKIFARFGIPEKVASDNRPQHSNTRHLLSRNHEFKKFADWAFSHTTSSAEYPQSNGTVERVKASAEKKDPFEGLLKCCNTPFKDIGVSPAQLLTSRRIQTMIRTHQSLLAPQPVDRDHVLKTLHHRHHHAKSNYDKQRFAST